MRTKARAARAVDQLSTLLRSEHIPQSVRRLGAQAQTRLAEPVRLSVVGHAEAQPAALANALIGGGGRCVLPEVDGLPPATVDFGEQDAWQIVTASGDTEDIAADAFGACDPYDLALLRRWTPLPVLENISLRVVALEGEESEVAAALRWALRGADMLLWCAQSQSSDAAWHARLPEGLQDHAFLAVRHGAVSDPRGFVAGYTVPEGAQDAELRDLREALLDHLSRGRREDMDYALMLLEKYLPRREAADVFAPVGIVGLPASTDSEGALEEVHAAQIDVGGGEDRPSDEPVRTIVHQLIDRAYSIETVLDEDGPAAVEELLEICANALGEAAGEATLHVHAVDQELTETLMDAADLMLLIQLEGSASALSDSLALMLQARHACEERLCA